MSDPAGGHHCHCRQNPPLDICTWATVLLGLGRSQSRCPFSLRLTDLAEAAAPGIPWGWGVGGGLLSHKSQSRERARAAFFFYQVRMWKAEEVKGLAKNHTLENGPKRPVFVLSPPSEVPRCWEWGSTSCTCPLFHRGSQGDRDEWSVNPADAILRQAWFAPLFAKGEFSHQHSFWGRL